MQYLGWGACTAVWPQGPLCTPASPLTPKPGLGHHRSEGCDSRSLSSAPLCLALVSSQPQVSRDPDLGKLWCEGCVFFSATKMHLSPQPQLQPSLRASLAHFDVVSVPSRASRSASQGTPRSAVPSHVALVSVHSTLSNCSAGFPETAAPAALRRAAQERRVPPADVLAICTQRHPWALSLPARLWPRSPGQTHSGVP